MNKNIMKKVLMILLTSLVYMVLISVIYYIYYGQLVDEILFKTYVIISLFGLLPIALKWYRLGYVFLISSVIGCYVDFYRSSIPYSNGMENGFINFIIMLCGFVVGVVIEVIWKKVKPNRV